MELDPAPRSSSPEKNGRSSFSSVRENDSDLAQSFTSTKVSSYTHAHAHEEAIDDATHAMGETQFLPPLTQPYSRLHGNWFPVNSFRGWKQINVKGKTASRSFSDLQMLGITWSSPPTPAKVNDIYDSGKAPIERLPIELLGKLDNSIAAARTSSEGEESRK
jgi:hypothetical protein